MSQVSESKDISNVFIFKIPRIDIIAGKKETNIPEYLSLDGFRIISIILLIMTIK